jgi:hypothetical protein
MPPKTKAKAKAKATQEQKQTSKQTVSQTVIIQQEAPKKKKRRTRRKKPVEKETLTPLDVFRRSLPPVVYQPSMLNEYTSLVNTLLAKNALQNQEAQRIESMPTYTPMFPIEKYVRQPAEEPSLQELQQPLLEQINQEIQPPDIPTTEGEQAQRQQFLEEFKSLQSQGLGWVPTDVSSSEQKQFLEKRKKATLRHRMASKAEERFKPATRTITTLADLPSSSTIAPQTASRTITETIQPSTPKPIPPSEEAPKKRGRPAGSKNKSKT